MTRRRQHPADVQALRRRLLNIPTAPKPFHDVVYHGTDVVFERFDTERIGTRTDAGLLGRGFYFSTDPAVANTWDHRVTARVELEHPLRLALPTWSTSKRRLVEKSLGLSQVSSDQLSRALAESGYDGVVLDYSDLGYPHQEIMVMDPAAIEILAVTDAPQIG